MVNNIVKALELSGVSLYKIKEYKAESVELFFVKSDLDMNRKKQVTNYEVTIYKDYEEDEQKYRGESKVEIYPNMTLEEMEEIFRGGLYSAGFVKNQYYPLTKNISSDIKTMSSNFRENSLEEGALKISDAVYGVNKYDKGGINSCEIFLNKHNIRILNSNGLDVAYEKYYSEVECITQWKDSQDVEMFNVFRQINLNEDSLRKKTKDAIETTMWREKAARTPTTGKYRIILREEATKEILNYYASITNARLIYQGVSKVKVGDNIQGDKVLGDKITMMLAPKLPYDQDGIELKERLIIENGQVKNIHGNQRFSYYLGTQPTGSIRDVKVEPGSKSLEEMRKGDCIELISFSSFEVDHMTGDFSGEIRLGFMWHDGVKTPVTGGSVSGNISDIENDMYLSKEVVEDDWYNGPALIEAKDVNIAGR